MSDELFPLNLPSLRPNVRRRIITKTKVLEATAGNEYRATFWPAPKYEYTVAYAGLRQAVITETGENEAERLLAFVERHLGSLESFLLDDPYDGVQRRVRFKADDVEVQGIIATWWELGTLSLVTVSPS